MLWRVKDLIGTSLPVPEPYLFLPELLVHCVWYPLDDDLSQDLFLETDKRVIPRQMLQPLRVPYFGILPMTSRFVQSIYFVTLFGNSSQSTNQQRFVERNSDIPILPVTTSNKICERNYHTTPGLVSFQLSVVLFVVGSAFEAKTNGTLAALFFGNPSVKL